MYGRNQGFLKTDHGRLITHDATMILNPSILQLLHFETAKSAEPLDKTRK